MAENVIYSADDQVGCGFMNVLFLNRFFGQNRSPGKPLLSSKENSTKLQSATNKSAAKPKRDPKISRKRPLSSAKSSTSSSSNSSALIKELPRQSSGNIIRSRSAKCIKTVAVDKPSETKLTSGSIIWKNSGEMTQFGNIYTGLTELDSEVVKNMGNEKYKMGKFREALALYNQAISLDPKKAAYYSNKSAALIGLGRLIEAVFECKEAINIEPSYNRAHHRLATLYFRLGLPWKAEHHYILSGIEADRGDIAKSRSLTRHLRACKKATERKDWDSLLMESQHSISLGADSAPQIVTMKIDALLNLHKHKEAYEALEKIPHFDTDSCCRLFGDSRTAFILTIQAQVYTVFGRFEEALAAIYEASRVDTSNMTNTVLKKIEAVTLVRSNGKHLYNGSKFSEAIVAYDEGLQLDPFNTVFLCNRGACMLKLGQNEKAVEDCTKALNVRPCYSKARVRRANSYAQLGKWEAAMKDYEILVSDAPEDEELAKYLLEAREQVKRQHFEDSIYSMIQKAVKDAIGTRYVYLETKNIRNT